MVSNYVEVDGLAAYSTNDSESYRRAAVFVDKILKGAKPSDLPVEQPTKFELAINLKTAKQIGLTIPPNLLARADRVIDEESAQGKRESKRAGISRANRQIRLQESSAYLPDRPQGNNFREQQHQARLVPPAQ